MDPMGFNYADLSEKEIKMLQRVEEEINSERQDRIYLLGIKADNSNDDKQ